MKESFQIVLCQQTRCPCCVGRDSGSAARITGAKVIPRNGDAGSCYNALYKPGACVEGELTSYHINIVK